MHPTTPFMYHSWGHCLDCDNDDVRLFKPRMEANTALQLVLFVPACRGCVDHLWKTQTQESINRSMLKYLRTPCGF